MRGRTAKAAASRTPRKEAVGQTKGAGRRKSAPKKRKVLPSPTPPTDSWDDSEEAELTQSEDSDSSFTMDPNAVENPLGTDGSESEDLLASSNRRPMRSLPDVRIPRSTGGGSGAISEFAARGASGSGKGKGRPSGRGRSLTAGTSTGRRPVTSTSSGLLRSSPATASAEVSSSTGTGHGGTSASAGQPRAVAAPSSRTTGGRPSSGTTGGGGFATGMSHSARRTSGGAAGGGASSASGRASSAGPDVGRRSHIHPGGISSTAGRAASSGHTAGPGPALLGRGGGSASGAASTSASAARNIGGGPTRGVGGVPLHTGRSSTGSAGGASAATTGTRTTSFRSLGAATLNARQHQAEVHDTGVGGVATIICQMTGQQLFDSLELAGVPKETKATLLGLLLQAVSPTVATMLGQPAPARDSPGERSARGIVANMLAPFSYGFIGPARLQFSQGQPTDATNNPLLAVGSHAWPKGRENVATVAATIIKAVVAARSELHGHVRGALVDFLIPMIEEEATRNNPQTAADLLRGVREQIADIDPTTEVLDTLLHRVMWRYTKAHMQSTRSDLSEGQLLGEERLHEDFLAQVVTPALLHAANDIAALPVVEIGAHESVVCKCGRKARAWGRLSNGGFSSTNQRAFQEGFWYSMLQFMTGPRRHASGILTIPKSDYGNPKIMRFLSPHAGGDDNLIVEETPAEDVHVEDAELGAYLDEMN